MDLTKRLWNFAANLFVIVTLLGIPSHTSAQSPDGGKVGRNVQPSVLTDAYGNMVEGNGLRFNYMQGIDGASYKIVLDHQNTILSRQFLMENPFDPAKLVGQRSVPALQMPLPSGSSSALRVHEVWRYGMYGSGIGESNIAVFDINHDGHLEMIMGGSSGGGFGSDDMWYVVKQSGPDTYVQAWFSNSYPSPIVHIEVADVDSDNLGEIFVGFSDGTIDIYDGLTLQRETTFTASTLLKTFVIANADNDHALEIITSSDSGIKIFSSATFQLEWSTPSYGNSNIAVGNVDTDAAPELVIASGYVIDGVSHQLEWTYPASGGFGASVQTGDLDGDGMAEIVGAASWYKITAFDADIRSPKWEIPTSLDIGAMLLADADLDGSLEVLYGDGQWGSIHCMNGQNQTQEWSIGNPEHGVTDISVGDVNNDGTLEVMWGAGATSTGSDYLYVADTVSHSIEWQSQDIDGPLSATAVGDVDDDGDLEIVMVSYESESGYDDGVIHIFDAATHELEWQSTDLPGIIAWCGVQSVVIGDVDDDGQTEFVIAAGNTYDGVFQVYNGATHSLERQSQGSYSGATFTALGIGDVDSDGHTEIVVGQDRQHTGATGIYILVFNGATGAEEWRSIGLDTYWGFVDDIDLADIDADGHVEILASVAGEKIYAYDGVTHQLDWFDSMSAYAIETSDIDADGNLEVLIGKGNGVIDAYQGNTHQLEKSISLGSSRINGILNADLNSDGSLEVLASNESRLFILTRDLNSILWQSASLGGSFLGGLNHLSVADLDDDSNPDIIMGSSNALYQFEATRILMDHQLFMPMVSKALPGLTGSVTSNGSAFFGAPLDLYFYNGSWSVLASTTTDSSGAYFFANPPALSSGQLYAVDYINPSDTYNNLLFLWETRHLDSYTNDNSVNIGDFDLTDLTLVAPSNNSYVSLPVTFQWNVRPNSPTDSYQFVLYSLDGQHEYESPLLGNVGSFTLKSLPEGFSYWNYYGWTVWINAPDGAIGVPYYYGMVEFNNYGSPVNPSNEVDFLKVTPDIFNILHRLIMR